MAQCNRNVAEVVALLRTGNERLVTLTGVGGCGKTRLAVEVALRVREDFPDGVWLVELAPISDPRRLRQRVAAALSLSDRSDHVLVPSLENRLLLLVLDNCEHLVEACATLADQLLSACSGLRMLATSREPLLIVGERQRRLAPLATPDAGSRPTPDTLATYPAVQLFIDRAQEVAPEFEITPSNASAVARICTLLDGIPLAIELAAAQVRVVSTPQLAARLEDCLQQLSGANRLAPTRQQTLRASLDWSYGLLSPAEQAVFRRLGVLVGSWSLEAADAVCADERWQPNVLRVLAALVDKSLVVTQQTESDLRYRLLEPVRQYATDCLRASGEVELAHERQARYCIQLAAHAEAELPTLNQYNWLRRLDAELDNIRTVIARAEQSGDGRTILRIVSPLYYFFWLRRHLHEAQHWYEVGLANTQGASADLRARGLFGLTLMRSLVGDNAEAEAVGQQAINACRVAANSGTLALVLVILAQTTLARGDLPRAHRLAEEAIRHARDSASRWALGHALILLAYVLHRQGESSRAIHSLSQALAIFEAEGDAWSCAFAQVSLGSLRQPGSVAHVAAVAGVRWSWQTRDLPALASALEYLALYGTPENTPFQVRLCSAAHALRQSARLPAPPGERDDVERHLSQARAELGEAAFSELWQTGQTEPPEEIVATALADPRRGGGIVQTRFGRGEALTRREREVALLLVQGATDKDIARTLTITEGTAGLHVHHVLAKLGLRSRAQVADRAASVGLTYEIEPDRKI
jgi:predicted ATPase/DNA-binding CsgD family transcriptional regulator